MDCHPSGEVRDLHPAREPRCNDNVVGGRAAKGRKELLLAHQPRYLVMLLLEAKRPRHPATTRVEIDNLGTGDAPQQAQQRSHPNQRPLVAVPLYEDSSRPTRESERR